MTWMMALVGLFLAFPFLVGVWVAMRNFHEMLCKNGWQSPSAWVWTLCVLAGFVAFMSIPPYLLGLRGYLVLAAMYVLFVGIGAKKVVRILTMAGRELDGDPNNDVPIPPEK